ncbi:hypothetical protein RhiirC2_802474 [Rhizophagus irregularis]|uniref:Uncharacterized protein n=1 Tax=Rhizophagus irregularis TaxID=588596 RepID=A0A2N1M1D1_9GLOM|nr:hypothetical protein RhiirC2_802474 [Rhizophagus irregularis]
MFNIREELINAVFSRADASIDHNIYVNFHEQYEFCEQFILADESLTEEEKTEAIRKNNKYYDRDKIIYNEEARRKLLEDNTSFFPKNPSVSKWIPDFTSGDVVRFTGKFFSMRNLFMMIFWR